MAVSSAIVPRGGGRRGALFLHGASGETLELRPASLRGWYPLPERAQASVFGPRTAGSVALVVDPQRGAATAARIRRPHLLPFSSPHLAAVPSALWRLVSLALVVAALASSVACAVWLARVVGDWQESKHIQAGPQVPATVVATGPIARGSQLVTVRYRDRAGAAHRLELRFPLGLASRILPGETTTVAYDPRRPGRAELAGHPRTRWQRPAYVAAGLVGLLAVTVWTAFAVWTGLHRERAQRHHVGVGLAGLVTLLALGTRIVLSVVSGAGAQSLPFPPNPPPPVAGRPAALPAVLSLAPPSHGPVVTPAQARRIVERVWPFRDRVLARRDLATLDALERGPALAVDAARLRSGDPPNRPDPPAHAPADLAVYVPRQSRFPARFLAEGVTTSAGQPFVELLVFSRAARQARWQIVYDTGFGHASGAPPLHPDTAILDAHGFDVVPPNAELPAADVVPALARYWQAWIADSTPPVAKPPFAPGTWTTQYGESVLGKQDEVDVNGHPAHVVYGDRPAPRGDVWTFGVDGDDELVCSPLHQTTTWSGTAHQDEARSKWGPDLAPGAYSTITAEIVREACVLVPPAGDLVAFGADRWVVGLRGTRA
jgi:hypothetical protein